MARIEKDCRDLRRTLLMLSTGTVAAALVAVFSGNLASAVALAVAAAAVVGVVETRQASRPDVVRVRKLEVVGGDGAVRVSIGETIDGAGSVATYDATGRFLSALTALTEMTSREPI